MEDCVACGAVKHCVMQAVGLSDRATDGCGDIRQTRSCHNHSQRRAGRTTSVWAPFEGSVAEEVLRNAGKGQHAVARSLVSVAAVSVERQSSVGSCDGCS